MEKEIIEFEDFGVDMMIGFGHNIDRAYSFYLKDTGLAKDEVGKDDLEKVHATLAERNYTDYYFYNQDVPEDYYKIKRRFKAIIHRW